MTRGSNPIMGQEFICSLKFKIGFKAHTSSYSTGALSPGQSCRVVRLMTQLRLVANVRMNGSVSIVMALPVI